MSFSEKVSKLKEYFSKKEKSSENTQLNNRGRATSKKLPVYDNKLHSSLYRIISSVENDPTLVKSLQSLAIMRGGGGGGATNRRNVIRKQSNKKILEDLALEALAREFVIFLNIVIHEGDLKSYLVLIKLVLCLWEDLKERGFEKFLVYLPIDLVSTLEKSVVVSKSELEENLRVLKENERIKSFENIPRFLVYNGTNASMPTEEYEVRKSGVGTMSGLCIRPHTGYAFFEVYISGYSCHDIFLGWSLCGNENLSSYSTTDGDPSVFLGKEDDCWVLHGASGYFLNNIKNKQESGDDSSMKERSEEGDGTWKESSDGSSTLPPTAGASIKGQEEGALDKKNEEVPPVLTANESSSGGFSFNMQALETAVLEATQVAKEKQKSKDPAYRFKGGTRLGHNEEERTYPWNEDTFVGCLLNTDTGKLNFYVNGVDITGDEQLFLSGSKFERSGVCPVFSSSGESSLFFNMGQHPYKYPPVVLSSDNIDLKTQAIKKDRKDKKGPITVPDADMSCMRSKTLSFLRFNDDAESGDTSSSSPRSPRMGKSSGKSSNSNNNNNKVVSAANPAAPVGVFCTHIAAEKIHGFVVETALRLAKATSKSDQRGKKMMICSFLVSGGTMGCSIYIDEHNSICLCVDGGQEMKTPSDVVKDGVWHQLAIVYPHKGSGEVIFAVDSEVVAKLTVTNANKNIEKDIVDCLCVGAKVNATKQKRERSKSLGGAGSKRKSDDEEISELLSTINASDNTAAGDSQKEKEGANEKEEKEYTFDHTTVWVGDFSDFQFWSSSDRKSSLPYVTKCKWSRSRVFGSEAFLLVNLPFEEGYGDVVNNCTTLRKGCPSTYTPIRLDPQSTTWYHTLEKIEMPSCVNVDSSTSTTKNLDLVRDIEFIPLGAGEVANASGDNHCHIDLQQLTVVLMKKLTTSCDRYLDGDSSKEGGSEAWFRAVQRVLPSTEMVLSPGVMNFSMLYSTLKQTMRMVKAEGYDRRGKSILTALSGALLRLLAVNLDYAVKHEASSASFGLQHSNQMAPTPASEGGNSSNNNVPLISKLLVLLFQLVSFDNPLANNMVREESTQVIKSGLLLFFPHPSDRIFLLECLYTKRFKYSSDNAFMGYMMQVKSNHFFSSSVNDLLDLMTEATGSGTAVSSGSNETTIMTSGPIDALLNVSPEGDAVLLRELVDTISGLLRAGELIPRDLRPLLSYSQDVIPSRRASLVKYDEEYADTPKVGFLVTRGPHWQYLDQDGGKDNRMGSVSTGVIIEVCDWLGKSGKCLRVLWSNGSDNFYRWDVEENVDGKQVRIFDVSILRTKVEFDKDQEVAGHYKPIVQSTATDAKVDEGVVPGGSTGEAPPTSYPNYGQRLDASITGRRVLQYTPEEVYESLIQENGSLTKRQVLSYIKEIAPEAWQQSHKLTWALNQLVKKPSREVADIYALFYSTFSSKEAPLPVVKSNVHRGDSKTYTQSLVSQLSNLMCLVTYEVFQAVYDSNAVPAVNTTHFAEDVHLRFLCTLQGLLTGSFGSTITSTDLVNVNYEPFPSNPSSFLKDINYNTFKKSQNFYDNVGASSQKCQWDWSIATWKSVCEQSKSGNVLNSNTKEMDLGKGVNLPKQVSMVDCTKDGIIKVTEKDKKKKDNKKKLANKDVAEKPWLEFTKSKGASSDLTSIVFADDMKPNTGIYRWTVAFGAGRSFVGVTSQHGKNSHEFLGNCNDSYCLTSEGYMFYRGQKMRKMFPYQIKRHTQMELVLDTDRGLLSCRLPQTTDPALILFEDLVGVTLFAAVGLERSGEKMYVYSPKYTKEYKSNIPYTVQDYNRHLADNGGVIKHDMDNFTSISHKDEYPVKDEQVLTPIAAPSAVLVNHTVSVLTCVSDLLETLPLEKIGKHPLCAYVTLQLVGNMARYQYTPSQGIKDLHSALNILLEKSVQLIKSSGVVYDSSINSGTTSTQHIPPASPSPIEMAKMVSHEVVQQIMCAVSALMGRLSTSWVFSSDSNPYDNRILVEELGDHTQLEQQTLSPIAEKSVYRGGNIDIMYHTLLRNGLRSEPEGIEEVQEWLQSPLSMKIYNWVDQHVRLQIEKRIAGTDLDTPVQNFFFAVLYHAGLLDIVMTYSKSNEFSSDAFDAKATKPSSILTHIMTISVKEVRIEARKMRQSVESTYAEIAAFLGKRINFLLELESHTVSTPCVLSTASRDDLFYNETSGEVHEQMFEYACAIAKDLKKFVVQVDEISLSVPFLKAILKTSDLYCLYRCESLKILQTSLLSLPDESRSAKCALLTHLPRAMKYENGCSYNELYPKLITPFSFSNDKQGIGHYSCGLEGVSVQNKKKVAQIFHTLYGHLSQELHDNSSHGATNVSRSLQSILINCLHIRVLTDDHGMISRVRIFDIIQGMLDARLLQQDAQDALDLEKEKEEKTDALPDVSKVAIEDTSSTEASEADASSKVGESLNTKDIMKLLVTLTTQVATSAEKVYQAKEISDDNVAVDPLPPPPLQRSMTGPSTLGKLVFDILYEQLYHVSISLQDKVMAKQSLTIGMKSTGDHADIGVTSSDEPCVISIDQDTSIIVKEVMSLLHSLCSDERCREVLCRPKWIALMLRLGVFCVDLCKEYSLSVLYEILPHTPVADIVNNMSLFDSLFQFFSSHFSSFVKEGEKNDTLIRIVLILLYCSGKFSDLGAHNADNFICHEDCTDIAKMFADHSVSLAAEATALVRLLIHNEDWGLVANGVLIDVLSASCNTSKISMTATGTVLSGYDFRILVGCLNVVGGHLDMFYNHGRMRFTSEYDPDAKINVIDACSDQLDHIQFSEYDKGMASKMMGKSCSIDSVFAENRFAVENIRLSKELLNSLLVFVDKILSVSNWQEMSDENNDETVNAAVSGKSNKSTSSGKVERELAVSGKSNKSTSSGKAEKELAPIFTSTESKKEDGPDVHTCQWELVRSMACRTMSQMVASPYGSDDLLEILFTGDFENEFGGRFLSKLLKVSSILTASGGLLDIPVYEKYVGVLSKVYRGKIMKNILDANSKKNEASTTEKVQESEKTKKSPVSSFFSSGSGGGFTAESAFGTTTSSFNPYDGGAAFAESEEMQALVDNLTTMGFPRVHCAVALQMCEGDADEALNYILANREELDIIVVDFDEYGRKIGGGTATSGGAQLQMFTESPHLEDDTQDSNSDGGDLLEEYHGANASENVPSEDNPVSYYYSGRENKIHPFYSEPSITSDRIGGLYPGDSISVVNRQTHGPGRGSMWVQIRISELGDPEMEEMEENDLLSYGDGENSDEDSYDGDRPLNNGLAWIQEYKDDVKVMIEGHSNGPETDLDDPPAEFYSVDAHYVIKGRRGCLVRDGPEIGTNEVGIVDTGTTVRVVEETINGDCTVRMKIVSPVQGWISKTRFLVEKISSRDAAGQEDASGSGNNTGTKSVPQKSIWHSLEDVDDDMEHWGGAEIFRRDDRFFGSLQGSQYKKYVGPIANEIFSTNSPGVAIYNRKSRVMGNSSYSGIFHDCDKKDQARLGQLLCNATIALSVLSCRRAALALIIRSLNGKYKSTTVTDVPMTIQAVLRACTDVGSTNKKIVTNVQSVVDSSSTDAVNASSSDNGLTLPPMSNAQSIENSFEEFLSSLYSNAQAIDSNATKTDFNSVKEISKAFLDLDESMSFANAADILSMLVRLNSFRGDPYTITGLEYLAMDDIDAIGMKMGDVQVTLDQVLEPLFAQLAQFHTNAEGICASAHPQAVVCDASNAGQKAGGLVLNSSQQFCNRFVYASLVSIAQHLILASMPNEVDHCWADSSYENDSDEDCFLQANLHYAQWLSHACLSLKEDYITYAIFRIWTFGIKGVSMSLKLVCFNMLSSILTDLIDRAKNDGDVVVDKDLLGACLSSLPSERLTRMGSKRLWHEMEDYPAYSRYLQALLQLISDIDQASVLLSRDSLEAIPLTRSNSLNTDEGNVSVNGGLNDMVRLPGAISNDPDVFKERPVLDFNTEKSYVHLGQNKDLHGSWTLEMWLRRGDGEITMELREGSKENTKTPSDGTSGKEKEKGDVTAPDSTSPRHGVSRDADNDTTKEESAGNKKDMVMKLKPMYLLQSNGFYIKLLAGGRVFNLTEEEDPLCYTEPVHERAYCIAVGSSSSSAPERLFNYSINPNQWVHLALCNKSGSSLSLYANGHLVETMVGVKLYLPLSTLGTSTAGHSYQGQVAEMRVWNVVRSALEIQRDMITDVSNAKGLVSHLKCREHKGVRVFDTAGLLNNSKLHNISWDTMIAPSIKKSAVPSFMLGESEEAEGFTGESIGGSAGVVEMTGVFRSDGLQVAAGDNDPNSATSKTSEVVCLCYREKRDIADSRQSSRASSPRDSAHLTGSVQRSSKEIEGYLDWCERGVRSQFTGVLNARGVVRFVIKNSTNYDVDTGTSTIVGPPETMQWLQELTFEGKVENGKLQGPLSFCTHIPCPTPVGVGQTRMDKFAIPRKCEHKTSLLPNGNFCESLKVNDDEPETEGQYIATMEVCGYPVENQQAVDVDTSTLPTTGTSSNDTATNANDSTSLATQQQPSLVQVEQSSSSAWTITEGKKGASEVDWDAIRYGLVQGDGNLWVEYEINNNASGSISFGACTSNALIHRDASVHANNDTWCYSTSGEASHGMEMSAEIVAGNENNQPDKVGLHFDMQQGVISFYLNNTQFLRYDNVNENPNVKAMIDPNSSDVLPNDQRGIRPFICLAGRADKVSYLGLKQGMCHMQFQEDHPLNFKSLKCTIDKGHYNGWGILTLWGQDEGYWYGRWDNGVRVGTHLWIVYQPLSEDSTVSTTNKPASTEATSAEGTAVDDNTENKEGEADTTNSSTAMEEVMEVAKYFQGGSISDLPPPDDDMISVLQSWTDAKDNGMATFRQSTYSCTGVMGEGYASASGSGSSPRSRDSEATVTFKVLDALGCEVHFKMAVNVAMRKAFDVYSQKKNIPRTSMRFLLDGEPIDPEHTPEMLDLQENDVINVIGSVMEGDANAVEKMLSESTAPYVIKIIYSEGATVRSGIEIEEHPSVRHLKHGEVVEAFNKAVTREGIPRFQILDGWVSEHLRGGNSETVLQVLKETLFTPEKYTVIREEGAKLRSTCKINSDSDNTDLGFVPIDTILEVSEKRLEVSKKGESTIRLRVVAPLQYVGWVSDKDHIVKKLSSAQDLELRAELSRRAQIRSSAKSKKSKGNSSTQLALSGSGEDVPQKLVRIHGSLDVSSETFFLMNGNKRHPNSAFRSPSIQLSEEFRTATCQQHFDSRSGRPMVLGSRGFTRGRHYWEVQIDKAEWGTIFIGVCPLEASSWMGYGLLNYRATQSFGTEMLYGKYLAAGDTVGILLDMDHGTVSFFKDGEDFTMGKHCVVDMGVAYHNVRRNGNNRSGSAALYPCFGMKQPSDCLSIRRTKWSSEKGLAPSGLLARYLQAKNIMSAWHNMYHQPSFRWSDAIQETMYSAYKTWRSHEKLILKSRPCMNVAVETSDEAIKQALGDVSERFNIYAGKCFTNTKYGDGRIAGAKGPQLWYTMDSGEIDAWYWDKDEVADLVDTGVLDFNCPQRAETHASKSSSASSAADSPVSRNGKEKDGSAPTLSLKSPRGEVSLLSFSMFLDHMFPSGKDKRHWTLEDDVELCRMCNEYADKYSVDPLRIPVDELESFRKETDRFGIRSSEEVQVRYSSLCVLNKATAIALPLTDFGQNDSRSSAIVSTFERSLVYASAHRDVSTQDVSNTADHKKHPLCHLFSQGARTYLNLKQVIYMSTKMQFWNVTMIETTHATSAPADEYDRPSGIPEITINRAKAKALLPIKDTLTDGEKYHNSVFGQLSNVLYEWESKNLRRAYIQMGDAGQARCFFVKLRGEGGDDHGGPYRAAFQAAIGEEATHLLDLMVPCPNGQAGVSSNQEKSWFNADLCKDPIRQRDFIFMGKLIGVACRHQIQIPLSMPSIVWKSFVGESISDFDLYSIDTHTMNNVRILEGMQDAEELKEMMEQMLMQVGEKGNHEIKITTVQKLVQAVFASDTNNAQDEDVQKRLKRFLDILEHVQVLSQNAGISFMHRGLSSSAPTELFTIFTPEELEVLLCGANEVDLEVLKMATEYDGVKPEDPHIVYFWEALADMDQTERAEFINFCSGRSRLPPSAALFPMTFKLQPPNPRAKETPDKYLPISQTCFFSLSLPQYSSKEIMKERIVYACKNTELIDADVLLGTADGWEGIQ